MNRMPGSSARFCGVCAQSEAVLRNVLQALLRSGHWSGDGDLELLCRPAARPRLVVAIAKAARPRLAAAHRPDGSFAVIDGELYDVPGLIDRPVKASEDAADVLLDLYLAEGEDALAQVDGAATFTLWDARRSSLIFARDRWGRVPGYWAECRGGIVWGWSTGALLPALAERTLNLAALDFFLGNGFLPAPWTLLRQVHKLPPAHLLRYAADGTALVRRYWRPTARPRLKLSVAETTERLGELFQASLESRCASGNRLGVLLSGGVDSKLVAAALRQRLGSHFCTFTFRYNDYRGRFNETDEARRTADYLGVQHHEIIFRPCDIAQNLEWMVRSYGEPFTYGLHTAMLGAAVEAGVTALVSGAGAGYLYPRSNEIWGMRYTRLPSVLQAAGPAAVRLLHTLSLRSRPKRLWHLYAAAGELHDRLESGIRCGRTGLPRSFAGMIIPDEFRRDYYRDPALLRDVQPAALALFADAASGFADEAPLDRITLLDVMFRAAEGTLHWNHWWSRAHGIAMRFPYLDHAFLGFALRLPRKSPDKTDLRRLAATLMPHDMAYAPKRSQTIPIAQWFCGPLKEFVRDHLTVERVRRSEVLDEKVVQRVLKEHLRGAVGHEWKLWAILTFMTWQDLVLRESAGPAEGAFRLPEATGASGVRIRGQAGADA